MSGFREKALRTEYEPPDGQTRLLRSQRPVGRETKNGQNKDLNNQNVEFGGPLKSQKMTKNEFTHGKNELLCSRVLRYNFKQHKS